MQYPPPINIVQNGIDPNNSSGIHRFSHLDVPIKYQYVSDTTILIPLGRFFDTIIDADYGHNASKCIRDRHYVTSSS